jgi:hypothetical protein
VVARNECVLKMHAPSLTAPGQPGEIIRDHTIHAGLAHGLLAEFSGTRCAAGAEQRSVLQSSLGDVFGNRFGRSEMDADGAVAVTFLIDSENGLVAVQR